MEVKSQYTIDSLRSQLKMNTVHGDAVEALKFLMKEYDKFLKYINAIVDFFEEDEELIKDQYDQEWLRDNL